MTKRQIIKKFWGVNKKKINVIFNFIGISNLGQSIVPRKIIKDLDLILSNFSNQKYLLRQKIQYWIDLKLIKGVRHAKGLPVNGQTIKRNAKTQKKLFKSRLI